MITTEVEKTLCIIKPDAVRNGHAWEILDFLENVINLKVSYIRKHKLSTKEARAFYKEHAGQDYFKSLIDFTTSGPCYIVVLEGNDAILRYRKIMGYYDPAKASKLSLRKTYGQGCPNNAVHGSDSKESAEREIELLCK